MQTENFSLSMGIVALHSGGILENICQNFSYLFTMNYLYTNFYKLDLEWIEPNGSLLKNRWKWIIEQMLVFTTRRARPRRIIPPRDQACNLQKIQNTKIKKIQKYKNTIHFVQMLVFISMRARHREDHTHKGPSL